MKAHDTVKELAEKLREFARERDWDRFHSPKNLVMALSAEAGELTEHFQWLTEQQSRELSAETLASVRYEIADVLIYLVRLADQLGVDPVEAANEKIRKNANRYPIGMSRGRAKRPS